MDTLEINDQFVVLLFEDKTGGAWCKKVTDPVRVFAIKCDVNWMLRWGEQ